MLPVMIFELITGYILGILMAKNKTKLVDNIGLMYVYLAEAIPYIVYLYLMAIFFRKVLGMSYVFNKNNIMTIIPAWITLWFISMATDAGYARRYTVDEMNADYVKFARSKGLSENRIFFTHIMRNTSVMLFRGIPIAVASALMGAYFLESTFSIPGIGQLLIKSIERQDIAIVQALTLIFSLLTVVSYLISDLLAIALDPRTSLIKNS
jgi:oligopeptide transport system permease protein